MSKFISAFLIVFVYLYICTLATSWEELTHWKRLWCWVRWRAGREGVTEDEVVGFHHWLNGHGSGWTLGVGDGQGGLVCCDSWGHNKSDTTERLNWTELNHLNKTYNVSVTGKVLLSAFPNSHSPETSYFLSSITADEFSLSLEFKWVGKGSMFSCLWLPLLNLMIILCCWVYPNLFLFIGTLYELSKNYLPMFLLINIWFVFLFWLFTMKLISTSYKRHCLDICF